MRKLIMILVTALVLTFAYEVSGHALKHPPKHRCECKSEKRERNHDKDFRPHSRDFKPVFKDELKPNHRKGMRYNNVTDVKDTLNGKTASVSVGSPLSVFEVELPMGE